jgi:hypothetical protein
MISAAQFWWDHLTWDQRAFIREHYTNYSNISFTEEEIASLAFKNKLDWHTVHNWPETPVQDLAQTPKFKEKF